MEGLEPSRSAWASTTLSMCRLGEAHNTPSLALWSTMPRWRSAGLAPFNLSPCFPFSRPAASAGPFAAAMARSLTRAAARSQASCFHASRHLALPRVAQAPWSAGNLKIFHASAALMTAIRKAPLKAPPFAARLCLLSHKALPCACEEQQSQSYQSQTNTLILCSLLFSNQALVRAAGAGGKR